LTDAAVVGRILREYLQMALAQPAEKDVLLEGIRFPAAYVGAIDLEQALLTRGARQIDGREAGEAAEPARGKRRRRGPGSPSLRLGRVR
jgi:hypothetical protein